MLDLPFLFGKNRTLANQVQFCVTDGKEPGSSSQRPVDFEAQLPVIKVTAGQVFDGASVDSIAATEQIVTEASPTVVADQVESPFVQLACRNEFQFCLLYTSDAADE